MEEYIPCFSCQAKSLNIEGETHEYMLSSPGCWAMFCEVMEKEYSDMQYARAHHYSVDTYACQHPGEESVSQAVNSVGIHLSSLYMLIEKNMSLAKAANFKSFFSRHNKEKGFIRWLAPPQRLGEMTVFQVWDSEDPAKHFDLCKEWATSTWNAWSVHHDIVKRWTEEFLKQSSHDFGL